MPHQPQRHIGAAHFVGNRPELTQGPGMAGLRRENLPEADLRLGQTAGLAVLEGEGESVLGIHREFLN